MPIDQTKFRRLDEAMDNWLKRHDSHDRDTDPKEFPESPGARQMPVAEPPNVAIEDAAPRRRDLFK
jgi:hypothetical protein